jgi:c-di-GMP-binding flagellar brake protein YcgR
MPHPIRDISQTGAYLVTEQRWRPGTIVTMTLQRIAGAEDDPMRSIAVQAKVVRQGSDGVGLRFILTLAPRTREETVSMGGTADKKTLVSFLDAVEPE